MDIETIFRGTPNGQLVVIIDNETKEILFRGVSEEIPFYYMSYWCQICTDKRFPNYIVIKKLVF